MEYQKRRLCNNRNASSEPLWGAPHHSQAVKGKIMDIKKLINKSIEKTYLFRYRKSLPGSKNWLIMMEARYGGIISRVPRNKTSSKDPRTPELLLSGGMSGGDRMSAFHHGYADKYAEYLKPFLQSKEPVTLVEVGILSGIGLAIWSDLFVKGRILGLDIDLGHINKNMDNLKKKGAFANMIPEFYEFDQFDDNNRFFTDILGGDKIDVFIDDGFHSTEAILTTMKSAAPHLAKNFVYFIEDNSSVHEDLQTLYPHLTIDHRGEFTVLFP
jgi:hypothetical protein